MLGSLQGTFKPPMSRVLRWGGEGKVCEEEGWSLYGDKEDKTRQVVKWSSYE
jgi:hypothetical protein